MKPYSGAPVNSLVFSQTFLSKDEARRREAFKSQEPVVHHEWILHTVVLIKMNNMRHYNKYK
jgi:hypothetical protein